jgi:dihydroorotate dehydrogenase electron transfer subunit
VTGPAGERCLVVARGRAGVYHRLTVAAPAVAATARAGQFVEVRPAADQSLLLRRAFSVHAADAAAGTVEVVFDVVGPGTRALAGVGPGDTVDVLGPFGRPFAPPTPPAGNGGGPPAPQTGSRGGPPACLLVGGGYGTAPLFLLAGDLRARGCPVDVLIGASTGARLLEPEACARLGRSLTVTTDDGSTGRRGVVTDPMPELLARARTRQVYACGPMPMLAAVSRTAAAAGVPCQVAVEERMACGTGICFSCVVPVLDGPGEPGGPSSTGTTRMARSCIEGPVFDGAAVAWAELGLAPTEAGVGFAPAAPGLARSVPAARIPGPSGGSTPGREPDLAPDRAGVGERAP